MIRDEDDVPPALTETLTGLRATVGPAGEAVAERLTVPEKPFRLVKVTIEVAEDPSATETADGEAETLKSGCIEDW